MNEKSSFGEYIHKKRLEAELTQRELAKRLYVTESTVSKWERGLSYPDVSMVTAVCAALGISEHEFFTACDDDQTRAQARQARHWRRRSSSPWACGGKSGGGERKNGWIASGEKTGFCGRQKPVFIADRTSACPHR